MVHQEMHVRKRNGRLVSFERERISRAIASAFRAELEIPIGEALKPELETEVQKVSAAVIDEVAEQAGEGVEVERIQDKVEIQLMRRGHYSVARRYIVYREDHNKARILSGRGGDVSSEQRLHVLKGDGRRVPLDTGRIRRELFDACRGLESVCDAHDLAEEVFRSLYDGIKPADIERAMVLAARQRVELEPGYGKVAARLLLNGIYREALGYKPAVHELAGACRAHFRRFVETGVDAGRLDRRLLTFDLDRLARALAPERDGRFQYLGLQTLYDRYLIHIDGRRIEAPQYFWLRVAMGLSLEEETEKDTRAIEFYNVMSTFRYISATPTLFNAGTPHPQLSSCYLSTTGDDLENIFKVISDNARLSKWAGGLGNDWTQVRATGAHIKGTNGHSQGVIPFLKVVSDTAVAVNQGGKRKGAVCAYLECWHLDVEDFLELRKNTGDERRRTHDMNTANWIPDLFMKRVLAQSTWTLFSPDEASDLHDLYGRAFERRYAEYEHLAAQGKIKNYRVVDAKALWRKMLSMLFETGHPWITFKDPSNVRSPQDHTGVVHSSNLCTEILLNTSKHETAVCNLGSVNLAEHVKRDGPDASDNLGLDRERLAETIRTAMRMLDNVIDINFYPTKEARNSNMRHRPIGLGIMGFQDALYMLNIPYDSDAAVTFADRSMEFISYHAIGASSKLAHERGVYETYNGSKWDRGYLPIDTLALLERERGGDVEMDRSMSLDWTPVREQVRRYGMRNSNVLAIAPTATISNIAGVVQSIEPTYRNLFVKSNLSGDFTVLNPHLVEALKACDVWDEQMVDDLKYYDGSLQEIDRVPDELKTLYKTAVEIHPKWLIEAASRRQKWIDMGQSLNLYIDQPSGKMLHEMYILAWKSGLKTTYYLRSLGATQIEKSSIDINKREIQPRWMKSKSASSEVRIVREGPLEVAKQNMPRPGDNGNSGDNGRQTELQSGQPAAHADAVCSLDEECEACQ